MEHHGSESYFVLGEGLLTESVGGRDRTLAAAAEAMTPPFRFSRMGPNGVNRQLGDPNRKKIGSAMTAGGGGASGRSRPASRTSASSSTTTSRSTRRT